MKEHINKLNLTDRSQFHFTPNVREAFSFLVDAGFVEVEALPTLVRYRKDDVEIDVYHGRQSYEIGCGFTVAGVRYSLSDFMRVTDPDLAKTYRLRAATSSESVATGLEDLSVMMQRYGAAVLSGYPQFLAIAGTSQPCGGQEAGFRGGTLCGLMFWASPYTQLPTLHAGSLTRQADELGEGRVRDDSAG